MAVKIIAYGIVFCCLFFQIAAAAQTPCHVCHVYGVDITEPNRGNPVYFGEVRPKFDEQTTKSFVFTDTDLIITLSIKYDFYFDRADAKPLSGSLDMMIREKGGENDSDSTDRTAVSKSFVKKFAGMKTAGLTIWKDKTYRFVAYCSSEINPQAHQINRLENDPFRDSF